VTVTVVLFGCAHLSLLGPLVLDFLSRLPELRVRGYTRRLGTVGFDPPIEEGFAFITRRAAHLTPATRAFMALAERHVRALA
jgi:hypothetical protein